MGAYICIRVVTKAYRVVESFEVNHDWVVVRIVNVVKFYSWVTWVLVPLLNMP